MDIKNDTVSTFAISVALAVIADAGPIPKAVVAVITETADNRLTPNLTNIGNSEAINNNPRPAADGIATNKTCPSGITNIDAMYGYFFNKLNGRIAKSTKTFDAPMFWIYATYPPIDIIIKPTPAFVLLKDSVMYLNKLNPFAPVGDNNLGSS